MFVCVCVCLCVCVCVCVRVCAHICAGNGVEETELTCTVEIDVRLMSVVMK